MNVAQQIHSNQIEIGIGGGVESMSMFAMTNMVDPAAVSEQVFEHPIANKCLMPWESHLKTWSPSMA